MWKGLELGRSHAILCPKNQSLFVRLFVMIDDSIAEASSGRVVGIIKPPPEIKAVVDKTAQFVARNGKSFEDRILSSEEGKSAKFHFMKPSHPFHAYYEMKISDFEKGDEEKARDDNNDSKTESEKVAKDNKNDDAQEGQKDGVEEEQGGDNGGKFGWIYKTVPLDPSLLDPVSSLMQKEVLTAPVEPRMSFLLDRPHGLTYKEEEMMKLTAQFAAIHGKEFLTGLTQRESRNTQYDFLKPTHLYYPMFSRLIEQYEYILNAGEENLDRIEKRTDKEFLLTELVTKFKWKQQLKEKEMTDDERAAAFEIDWYDFVVVDTVVFDDKDDAEDQKLADAAAVRSAILASTSTTNNDGSIAVGAATTSDQNEEESEGEDMEMEDDSDEDEELQVVQNYQPRLGEKKLASGDKPLSLVDPISGREVPAGDVSEHMKTQLLDPRHRVEQQRFLDKQKQTGLAAGGDVADNLLRFAKNREDIFGESVGKDSNEGTNQSTSTTVAWDGSITSIDAVKQQKKDLEREKPVNVEKPSASTIGPSRNKPPAPPP